MSETPETILISVDRDDLQALIKGCPPYYSAFNHPLVVAAGHSYHDQSGRTDWKNIHKFSLKELLFLYAVCKASWKNS